MPKSILSRLEGQINKRPTRNAGKFIVHGHEINPNPNTNTNTI